MFKEIKTKITAEDIKNRILAYASLQAAQEKVDEDYWYGHISTYTLCLRLSGIYGEKQFNDVLSSGADRTLNIGKYPYLENEVFLRETQHLDDLNFVQQLYQAFLARAADPGGLEGNVNQLKNGAPRANLVIGLRNSGEADGVFLRVTECLDDQHFLEIAHRVYLQPENRQARWSQDIQALEKGLSRESVFQDLKQFQQLQTALKQRQGDFYREDAIFLRNTQDVSNEDFVKELYLTYCKREADPGGLAGNIEQLNNGVTRADLLWGLRTSEEAANVFVDLTAGLENSTFVTVAYMAYRKEELTPEQKEQCLKILETGKIRQTILRDELTPPESSSPKEPVETIETESSQSPQEMVLEQLQDNFAQEDTTFLTQTENLSDQDFVKQLYLTYLQREVDPDGLDNNVEQLIYGATRQEILYAVRTSEESANIFVELTANLTDSDFIELAYSYYRQENLEQTQKEQDLANLASGAIRQTILRNCPPLPETLTENIVIEPTTSDIEPEIATPFLDLEQILIDLKIEDQDLIVQTENLTDEEFIKYVYRVFFRREADLEGLASHVEQLAQGVSRWELLYDLRTSTEAINVLLNVTKKLDDSQFLDVIYEVYFKRELDSENKAAYLDYLEQGHPRQDILG